MKNFDINLADAHIAANALMMAAARARRSYTVLAKLRAPGEESVEMVMLREQYECYERVAKTLSPSARGQMVNS